MHKLVALYHEPADRDHFRTHLLEVHLPIVRRFPRLRAMRVAFDLVDASGASSYFAMVECGFDDQADLQEALASPAGIEASQDVPNYAGAGVTILTFDSYDALQGDMA
ncbi:EthD family reductase [Sphingomonas sp. SRS2]|uniref:EthD family reductase n=1 Tax=Sphingomonas sp. SRS2 TaxID=133190 RepID=UPI0006184203|nr:EthD family reductase [Sphingomonas sp. SRS2]KKC26658.1 hypothetical protein WP12_06825 [Sphingomonas sp. SRS2]